MDLYVEKQCLEQIQGGELKKFMLLYDANFSALYNYVYRRVADPQKREEIVRLTWLDALGQVLNAPTDISFLVWLYSLARPRVWSFLDDPAAASIQGGLLTVDAKNAADQELQAKVENMLKKLSFEEKEILRLKFFEEVADGDVMTVLGMTDGVIGPKIYRVLKRAHFLLFGESDDRQGVYFGELSGMLARLREMELIENPEAFKLTLRSELSKRIDQKEFAFEGEAIAKKQPFTAKGAGSNDPAKIFVEAVKEMREEEEAARVKAEAEEMARHERRFAFFERWRWILAVVPLLVFVVVVGYVGVNLYDYFFPGSLLRGYSSTCGIELEFEGDLADGEKRLFSKQVGSAICDYYGDIESLKVSRAEGRGFGESVQVTVDLPDWMLDYEYVLRSGNYRLNKYVRSTGGNQESGKVPRDKRSSKRLRTEA